MAVLCAVTLSGGEYAAAHAASFTDVPESHWAYTYVEQAAAKGYVNGVGDGRFNPDGSVTYAEFAALLIRAFWPAELAKYPSTPWYLAPCMAANSPGHFLFVDTAYTTPEVASRTVLDRSNMVLQSQPCNS